MSSFSHFMSQTIYGNTSDPCTNPNSTCNFITIGSVHVYNPMLFPTCVLAAYIGFSSYLTISKTNMPSSKFYAMTFAMFGMMMSDAFFNDSILSVNGTQSDLLHFVFMIIDVGLTSTIGMTFAFNGLIDVGLISESTTTFTVWGFLSGLLFGLWTYVIQAQYYEGFMYLYVYVIGFSCGLYCILEVYYLIKNRSSRALVWVAASCLTGGFGLASITDQNIAIWFCHNFGCFFGGEFMWFLLSDIAMYCCFRYYMSRVTSNNTHKYAPLPVDNTTVC